jgi:hypothetical protein
MAEAAQLGGRYAGPHGVRITAGSEADRAAFNTLFVDPLDPDVLWGTADWAGRRGLWRGRQAGEEWSWEFLKGSGEKTAPELAVWLHNGRTHIAFTYSPGRDRSHVMELSTDGGVTWAQVLELGDILGLRRHAWLEQTPERPTFSLMGPIGYEDSIFCTYFSFRHRKALGLFRGLLQPDGTVDWSDFTADLAFPVANRSRVVENNGAAWLYVSTRGTGCWRRKLGDLGAEG